MDLLLLPPRSVPIIADWRRRIAPALMALLVALPAQAQTGFGDLPGVRPFIAQMVD